MYHNFNRFGEIVTNNKRHKFEPRPLNLQSGTLPIELPRLPGTMQWSHQLDHRLIFNILLYTYKFKSETSLSYLEKAWNLLLLFILWNINLNDIRVLYFWEQSDINSQNYMHKPIVIEKKIDNYLNGCLFYFPHVAKTPVLLLRSQGFI